MARLTLEDCLLNVGNRYDLVLLASKRARALNMGHRALIDEGNDKPTVIALREIAKGLITKENVDTVGRENTSGSLHGLDILSSDLETFQAATPPRSARPPDASKGATDAKYPNTLSKPSLA